MYADATYHSNPTATCRCSLSDPFVFALPTDCLIIVVVETVDQVGLV